MPTRLVHLVFDANDPPKLARFWAAALGWEVAAEEPDEVVVWPSGFDYPGPAALPLVFVPVPEAKTVKNRVHLDLATESPSTAHGMSPWPMSSGRAPSSRSRATRSAWCPGDSVARSRCTRFLTVFASGTGTNTSGSAAGPG